MCTLQLYEGFFIYERIYSSARYMAVLIGVCLCVEVWDVKKRGEKGLLGIMITVLNV